VAGAGAVGGGGARGGGLGGGRGPPRSEREALGEGWCQASMVPTQPDQSMSTKAHL
jgi:hypothetical protein